jgi:nephrocystin-3
MAELGDAPQSRVVRVFLSSTFRDFMQERDLLVKQVFPELRRKARERGVEVVEVDLRWGITEEESRHGKVLPICLAEIQRCRPYFVGMLGERYGWVPPDDEDNRVVLAEEEYSWVEEHLGRRSVTEMEILHGVLNDPEMAGRAFFYFRDPAWSQAQTEPGFVCDTGEEKEKLADLKRRIHDSRFPVVQDLPVPEALADRIGADLWALIEEQFPELDQPDALEREERKHASYRRARTELYEDGGNACVKVSQLEEWIAAGEQRILITGDSGAGKSALIANWMQRHQQMHPGDVFHAHHLGCSNDANALEPMLARMVQAASKLMAEESDQTLSEPIKIPQDYWELVSAVTDTLSKLSFWCKQQGRRWIWVLDGLDRLPEENQQALPWLPLQLFPHLHVVISALDCPARTILQQREYTTLTIAPLERDEQKALIASYMRRYNKTLVPELEAKILDHHPHQGPPPASSPLFLRVVLDELRVCGRHETLAQQLDDYLTANSVDGLYAKVLERLELDVGCEPVQKVMTAFWASRAGLSESELLAITGVAPLQWARIDLGLDGSLGRNGERLAFDHDYLRKAVQEKYFFTEEDINASHKQIADWIAGRAPWNDRDASEMPWQWMKAGCKEELREHICHPLRISCLNEHLGSAEVLQLWQFARFPDEHALDRFLGLGFLEEIEQGLANPKSQIGGELVKLFGDRHETFESFLSEHQEELAWMAGELASLFKNAGLYRSPLLRLSSLLVEIEKAIQSKAKGRPSQSLPQLAEAQYLAGDFDASANSFAIAFDERKRMLGMEHPSTLVLMDHLGTIHRAKGDLGEARYFTSTCLKIRKRILGEEHPDTLATLRGLGSLDYHEGHVINANKHLSACFKIQEGVLGGLHIDTIRTGDILATVVSVFGDYEQEERLRIYCLESRRTLLGDQHPEAHLSMVRLAGFYAERGDCRQAEQLFDLQSQFGLDILDAEPSLASLEALYIEGLLCLNGSGENYWRANNALLRCLQAFDRRLGSSHPQTLSAIGALGLLFGKQGNIDQAELFFNRCIDARSAEYPNMLDAAFLIAEALSEARCFEQAESCYLRCLRIQEELYGSNNASTLRTVRSLVMLMTIQDRYEEAIDFRYRSLAWVRGQFGDDHRLTLGDISQLAWDLRKAKRFLESEKLYREFLSRSPRVLDPHDHENGLALLGLAQTLEKMEQNAEALIIRERHREYRSALKKVG